MKSIKRILLCICALFTLASGMGVYATWVYVTPADPVTEKAAFSIWNPEYALDNALTKFLDILNNKEEATTYQELCEIFGTGASASSWGTDGSYTGSVDGCNQSDEVKTLFGGKLEMDFYGETVEVSVLLKRENLDNDETTGIRFCKKEGGLFSRAEYWTGAEMVMYYTIDTLKTAGKTDTQVFASVFSVKANGESETPAEGDKWQLLATYEGTATTTNWRGQNGTGSFNTDTWRSLSTDTYTRYDNITENPIVGAQELSYLVQNEQQAQEGLKKIKNS